MENKKMIWLLSGLAIAVICLVTVSVVSLCTAASVMKEDEGIIKNADRADIMTVDTADNEPIYFVREHEGVIGVFSEDNALIEKLNVAVMTLPKKDRTQLKEGITVKGTKNLEDLKEDYSGKKRSVLTAVSTNLFMI